TKSSAMFRMSFSAVCIVRCEGVIVRFTGGRSVHTQRPRKLYQRIVIHFLIGERRGGGLLPGCWVIELSLGVKSCPQLGIPNAPTLDHYIDPEAQKLLRCLSYPARIVLHILGCIVGKC